MNVDVSQRNTYCGSIRGVDDQIWKMAQNIIEALHHVVGAEDFAIEVRDEDGSELPVVVLVVQCFADQKFYQAPLQVLNVDIAELLLE